MAQPADPPPPLGDALCDYAQAELRRAIDCFGWRGGRVHAGVHQGRKSLRRVRAVLALGGERLGPGMPLLDRELRRICRSLSAERDAQALVETLDHLRSRTRSEAMAAHLRRARRQAAALRAKTLRDTLAADPALGGRRARLRVLLAALPALEWRALDADAVQAGLARSRGRVGRAAARALRRGKPADWHRLRRRLRRLAQQATALRRTGHGGMIGAPPDRHLAAALGWLQDLQLLRARCSDRAPFGLAGCGPLAALVDAELDRRQARLAVRLQAILAAGQATPPTEQETA
ncbi:CHAD domain-containing protein [Rehaibacterium terrae]|uniref:CHAD domain-containing protein n=1 Tax=Rehaibacterium terrae TaxID=1341696 RepID=A0A7W7Y1H7_9GAMM|nr:CHAD domain-containing protein [Rehaibacterium terrae]MBB5016376.1 CHAD domain-containing protein [Rehaibacterium terrae]